VTATRLAELTEAQRINDRKALAVAIAMAVQVVAIALLAWAVISLLQQPT
jgi:hypothetical protein